MDTFMNPSDGYRGTELYMLNDKLEGEELSRQIALMKEQGFYSFVARTYVGHKSDYPGKEFMARTREIIDACKKHDMRVFLQAGYMPGGVVGLPDEYAHLKLKPIKEGDERPNSEIGVLMNRDGVDYAVLRQPAFLDLLSETACRYYVKKSYEEMWAEFKDEYGKTVLSVWVDEPHFRPPDLPWTEEFPAAFKEMWGYDILPHIYSLFVMEGEWKRVRYHYWRTVLRLLQNAYFKVISGWCKQNGLMFSGHLMGEDTLSQQIGFGGSCMPLYKYFDIPGIDYLTADLSWRSDNRLTLDDNYLFVNTPLQCVSAAHQAGKKRILCEMFGVSRQGLTIADQRFYFDFFASLGINHKMTHAVFYSLKGRAKRTYPPHINYYQPYFDDYSMFNDYCARVSWFISQGKPAANTLILHPVEAAFSNYKFNGGPIHELNEDDLRFNELLQRLLAAHVPFELGDEETIAECGSARGGKFVVGEMEYGAVALPNLGIIRESTLALLEEFAHNGGRVLLLGEPPQLLDGLTYDARRLLGIQGLERVDTDVELARLLTAEGEKEYRLDCDGDGSSVLVNQRRDDKGVYAFLFNLDKNREKSVTLSVKGDFAALLCEADTGKETPVCVVREGGETRVSAKLLSGGSAMLRFYPSVATAVSAKPRTRTSIEIEGPFDIKRLAPNALLLEMARLRVADGEYSPPYPILAIQHILLDSGYEGEISLEYTIVSDCEISGAMLALEEPNLQKATLNGVAVAMDSVGYYCDKSFETINLPRLCRGENKLVLTRRFFAPIKPKTNYTALFENLGGVELEAAYLLGDFAVNTQAELNNKSAVRLSPMFTLTNEKSQAQGDLTACGYPFYAGSVLLCMNFALETIPQGKAMLALNGFDGCVAEVTVNGVCAGRVCWQPYSAEVTGLLRAGENRVDIRISGTLRNLLGPYHRPGGDIGHCWGSYSITDVSWMGSEDLRRGMRVKDWYDHRTPDSSRWTESYMQVPFGLSGIHLEFVV